MYIYSKCIYIYIVKCGKKQTAPKMRLLLAWFEVCENHPSSDFNMSIPQWFMSRWALMTPLFFSETNTELMAGDILNRGLWDMSDPIWCLFPVHPGSFFRAAALCWRWRQVVAGMVMRLRCKWSTNPKNPKELLQRFDWNSLPPDFSWVKQW